MVAMAAWVVQGPMAALQAAPVRRMDLTPMAGLAALVPMAGMAGTAVMATRVPMGQMRATPVRRAATAETLLRAALVALVALVAWVALQPMLVRLAPTGTAAMRVWLDRAAMAVLVA
jgi:hypothetical protein